MWQCLYNNIRGTIMRDKVKIRAQVDKFADNMYDILTNEKNISRIGGENISARVLVQKVDKHLAKLDSDVRNGCFSLGTLDECIDVANYCMFLYERIGKKV